jgi:hypothetical protein
MSENEPGATLKPCPHCGGEADLHIDGLYNVVIECEACRGVYTGWPLRSQLLQAWNRRDGEAARIAQAVEAERARIEAGLQAIEQYYRDEAKGHMEEGDFNNAALCERLGNMFVRAIKIVQDTP